MKALELVAFVLITPDLDRAAAFYTGGLGFRPGPRETVRDTGWLSVLGFEDRHVVQQTVSLGAQTVVLMRVEPAGLPYPPDSTATDLWFQHLAIVVGDMSAAYAQVMAAGARPISQDGPQHLPPSTGSVQAFKFRDPDGHPLELLYFPPGAGDACWHSPTSALFRGIDHSAIAVSAADALEADYRETLALRRSDATLNHGSAQDHLDAVAHDRVDVVALSAEAATPHLELLGYRTGSRRPIPPGTDPADVAATRLVFTVDTVPGDAPGRRTLADGAAAMSVRDRDGHRLIVRERRDNSRA